MIGDDRLTQPPEEQIMDPTERDDEIVPDDEAALVVDEPDGDNPYVGEPGEQEDGA